MRDPIAAWPIRNGGTSAMLIAVAVGILALPSAVLAFTSGDAGGSDTLAADVASGAFVASQVDPRLARSITVRALSKGRLFRFTPAATPSRFDNAIITVAVRLPSSGRGIAVRSGGGSVDSAGGLRIASTAYSLGASRSNRGLGMASGLSAADPRRGELPDLAAYRIKPTGEAGDPSRFAPRLVLDEREKTGRSPRTFEQANQTVDLGGSYRVTRNLNVTAGVRYKTERDRLVPITDGTTAQENQAVYVGTQFRF